MHLDYSNIKSNPQVRRYSGWEAVGRLAWLSGGCYLCLIVFAMLGGVIDQPHPVYASGNWVTSRFVQSMQLSAVFTVPFSVASALSFAIDFGRHQSVDVRILPSLSGFRTALHSSCSRLVFAVGILGVAGYIASTEIEYWALRHIPCGMIWPPERFFLASVWLLCVLWLGETSTRPATLAWVAAAAYLCFSLLLGYPMANSWLRE